MPAKESSCLKGRDISRLGHNVPGGVAHDPNAIGSTTYEKHIKGGNDVDHNTSEGPGV
jgi:hypothetical protein